MMQKTYPKNNFPRLSFSFSYSSSKILWHIINHTSYNKVFAIALQVWHRYITISLWEIYEGFWLQPENWRSCAPAWSSFVLWTLCPNVYKILLIVMSLSTLHVTSRTAHCHASCLPFAKSRVLAACRPIADNSHNDRWVDRLAQTAESGCPFESATLQASSCTALVAQLVDTRLLGVIISVRRHFDSRFSEFYACINLEFIYWEFVRVKFCTQNLNSASVFCIFLVSLSKQDFNICIW